MARSGKFRGVGIGAGYFSQFHYEAWSRIDEIDIVAVCDLDCRKAEAAAAAHGIDAVNPDVASALSS